MKYEQKITLKNGKAAILRSAEGTDAAGVLENFIATHEETDYLLSYTDENGIGVKEECEFLERKSESQSPRPIKGRGLQLTHEVLASYSKYASSLCA